jgi:hypothetical protein
MWQWCRSSRCFSFIYAWRNVINLCQWIVSIRFSDQVVRQMSAATERCDVTQVSDTEHNYTALQNVVQALQTVRTAGSATVIAEPFPLSRLVPEFSNLYLTYNGSLTTPPCTETVSWVIRKEPLTVSRQQVCLFRVLCLGKEHNLRDGQCQNISLLWTATPSNMTNTDIRGWGEVVDHGLLSCHTVCSCGWLPMYRRKYRLHLQGR